MWLGRMIEAGSLDVGDVCRWDNESRRFVVYAKSDGDFKIHGQYLDNGEKFHTHGFQSILKIPGAETTSVDMISVIDVLSSGDLCRYLGSCRRFVVESWSTGGLWCRYLDTGEKFYLTGCQPIVQISMCWWKAVSKMKKEVR